MAKKKRKSLEHQQAKTLVRIHAARHLAEGETEKGLLLALAAVLLPEEPLLDLLRSLEEGRPDWPALAFHLLAHPPREPLKGSWPGSGGWLFLDQPIRMAALHQRPGLVSDLSRIALSAPLFLAATVAAAAAAWGPGEELERLTRQVLDQANRLAHRLGFPRYLGPMPNTRPAPTQMDR